MITSDLTVFFDLNGFASNHLVNGVSRVIVVGDTTAGYSELDNTWVEMTELLIKKTDLSSPVKRGRISLDSVSYSIETVKDDGEVYTLTISPARVGDFVEQI